MYKLPSEDLKALLKCLTVRNGVHRHFNDRETEAMVTDTQGADGAGAGQRTRALRSLSLHTPHTSLDET